MYECKILLDSISPAGHRLTTFQITFPRIILAEFNTHRMISRNAASSRAIPVKKMIQDVVTNPFIPSWWGKNRPGMVSPEEISDYEKRQCISRWLHARDIAVKEAQLYIDDEVSKGIANRALERWMWTTVIATATEWENFFYLRQDESIIPPVIRSESDLFNPEFPAEPHMQIIACMMRLHYRASTPTLRRPGDWHLPLVDGYDLKELEKAVEAGIYLSNPLGAIISTGRCARVSYLTHEGIRDPQKDIELHDSLLENFHMSPFEHAARVPATIDEQHQFWFGNFKGWEQYRKMIPSENQIYARAVGDKRG